MTFPEGEQADTNQIEKCFRPTREDIKSMTFPEGEQANTSQKKNCIKPTWEDIQSMTFPEGEAQKVNQKCGCIKHGTIITYAFVGSHSVGIPRG